MESEQENIVVETSVPAAGWLSSIYSKIMSNLGTFLIIIALIVVAAWWYYSTDKNRTDNYQDCNQGCEIADNNKSKRYRIVDEQTDSNSINQKEILEQKMQPHESSQDLFGETDTEKSRFVEQEMKEEVISLSNDDEIAAEEPEESKKEQKYSVYYNEDEEVV